MTEKLIHSVGLVGWGFSLEPVLQSLTFNIEGNRSGMAGVLPPSIWPAWLLEILLSVQQALDS